MTVEIGPERPQDPAAILEVERAAFGEDKEAVIVQVVREEAGAFALVAVEDGHVVAHVQFSRGWVGGDSRRGARPDGRASGPSGSRNRLGAHRGRARRGRGTGRDRRDAARQPAFYPRFGFVAAARFGLRNPFTGVTDTGFVIAKEDFMIAPLDDRAQALAGEVRWHPAFG